ncbi:MAG: carboxypeptidase regulatory-like domain-containing protein, partial [Gemmatimonadetes bacterium]|nr:carboxypeptidase regulatory-like domain-containing protein [Gemmatimonadota bacterium]
DGAPVAGALVEAWSAATGTRRSTTTNDEGRYTLLFPDGGGRYRLRVSQIGMQTYDGVVARRGDEEVLVADVRLKVRPVPVAGMDVAGGGPAPPRPGAGGGPARAGGGGRKAPPGQGDAGATARALSGDLLAKLPLDNTDPASIAALTPGVVSVGGADSAGGAGAFSVAGQRASQNQTTLDGATFASMLSGGAAGGSPLGLPREGIRSSQVVTNTYDVARGQFSGGQVAMTTQGGTNTFGGSVSYERRGDALQGRIGRTPWAGGFAQDRLSGGVGGALKKDRLFYNVSMAAHLREDGMFALAPRTPAGFGELGVSGDSVARFLDILRSRYGLALDGQTGPYERDGTALSTLARVDWTPSERHTLTVRGYTTDFDLKRAFIRPLDLRENGGALSMNSRGLIGSVTSVFGTDWVNELRVSYARERQDVTSSLAVPEGRVRVASELAGGGTGVATLAFGGDFVPPRRTSAHTLEVADEASWLVGSHRLKAGALLNRTGFDQETALGRNGTFFFGSLADLEAGRPTSFTRSLIDHPTSGSGWNAAFYLGDTWRATDALQLVYGVRVEGSGFGRRPAYDAAVEQAFGVRTDEVPSELHVSPRLGFSWRVSPLTSPPTLLRGGIGEFRGRTPYSLYAGALDGTASAVLTCVGDGVVPAADFGRFRQDPSTIPTACADGTAGAAATGARPAVTVFAPDFEAPRSWRASLGVQTSLRPGLSGALDAMYALGVAQYGVRDRNLAAPAFTLAGEAGRPVFAPASAIDARTGQVPLTASRRDPHFSYVYEVNSGLRSRAASATLSLNGLLPRWRASFQASYTLAVARDQSSFTFGGAPEGFMLTATRGDPNHPEYAASDMDRRHQFLGIVGLPLSRAWELSLIGRAISGAPFTPRVGGDLNGDGAANDAAFVYDPATAGDPELAQGMARLLERAPGRVARCLREQLGTVARRNSCRGDWNVSLDLRLAYTPTLRGLGRRLTIGVDAFNLASGLDLALHGSDGAHGWGQGGLRSDDVLLYPRGFDPATRSFRYEVNQNFGRSLTRAMGMRAPFGIQLSGRLALGPDRGPDPLGGFLGLGVPAGARVVAVTSTLSGAVAARSGGSSPRVQFRGPGAGGPTPMDLMLPLVVDSILALRDTLKLSPEQVARIQEIADSLDATIVPIRAELGNALGGGLTPNAASLFEKIGPRVNAGRAAIQAALERVQAVLTPEQWEKVPERLKSLQRAGQIRIRTS